MPLIIHKCPLVLVFSMHRTDFARRKTFKLGVFSNKGDGGGELSDNTLGALNLLQLDQQDCQSLKCTDFL